MSNLSYDSFMDTVSRLTAPRVQASEILVEQFRKPRSKKRRIRNKWAKRPVNWRPMRGGYLDKMNNVLYVHPEILAKMEKALDKEPQSR